MIDVITDDAEAIERLLKLARSELMPQRLIDKIPKLTRTDPKLVREVADELAEIGYPHTANAIRQRWR